MPKCSCKFQKPTLWHTKNTDRSVFCTSTLPASLQRCDVQFQNKRPLLMLNNAHCDTHLTISMSDNVTEETLTIQDTQPGTLALSFGTLSPDFPSNCIQLQPKEMKFLQRLQVLSTVDDFAMAKTTYLQYEMGKQRWECQLRRWKLLFHKFGECMFLHGCCRDTTMVQVDAGVQLFLSEIPKNWTTFETFAHSVVLDNLSAGLEYASFVEVSNVYGSIQWETIPCTMSAFKLQINTLNATRSLKDAFSFLFSNTISLPMQYKPCKFVFIIPSDKHLAVKLLGHTNSYFGFAATELCSKEPLSMQRTACTFSMPR